MGGLGEQCRFADRLALKPNSTTSLPRLNAIHSDTIMPEVAKSVRWLAVVAPAVRRISDSYPRPYWISLTAAVWPKLAAFLSWFTNPSIGIDVPQVDVTVSVRAGLARVQCSFDISVSGVLRWRQDPALAGLFCFVLNARICGVLPFRPVWS